jgi:hypothetical protein
MKISGVLSAAVLLAFYVCAGHPAFAGPTTFQDWSGFPGTPYMDTIGSKSDVSYADGPDGRIAKHKFTILPGGWAGFWQNLYPVANLSRARTLKFKIKCTLPGDALVGLYDMYHVQYIAYFKIPSSDFTEVTVPVSAFIKNPSYTPPDAILGHGMDLTQSNIILFAPIGPGTGVMRVGPVDYGTVDPYVDQYPASRDQYLAAGRKMELPEDARKYFVQGEAAIKEKSYNEAINLFYKGLEAAPWYPDAHYNLSILLAEQDGNYAEAIGEMKKFIELSPDSPQVRASKDKMYEWERKE